MGIITLILNVLLLAFVALGFLFGLKGVKKATKSLVTFIIAMFIVFLISPPITKLLLKINIAGMSINEHVLTAVNSMLGEDIASQSFIVEIVNNIPTMIVNIVTTMLLLIIVSLLCKLVVAIISKIFKKDNDKEVEKCEIVNGSPQMIKVKLKENKHRLLGGFVGAFKGLLVCLAFFLPIVGLGNVIVDISGLNSVSAESTSGTELKPIKELVKEDLPKEVFDSVEAINNSFISKIGRIGNVGEVSLNLVAKCNINGKSIRLGQEIKALCGTYDKFVEFTRSSNSGLTNIEDIFNDMMENPENYNFALLDELLDELFNSNIVNATGNNILIFAVDSISQNSNEATKLYLSYLKTAIENNKSNSLKNDVKAFFNVFEISAKSGLIKVFQSEELKLQDISNILLNEPNVEQNILKNEVLNNLCEEITSSILLQQIAIESTNYGIDELEKVLNNGLKFANNESISLKNLDSKSNIKITATELSNLLESACKTIECIEEMDFDIVGEDIFNLFDYNIEGAVENAGNLLQTIADMEMFKQSGSYDSLCDAMSLSEINEYVNFSALKSSAGIKSQFKSLSIAVKELKASGIMNSIKEIDDNNLNEKLNEIAYKLAQTEDGKTYVNRIVTSLLECKVADNSVKYGLTFFENYLSELVKTINPDQEEFAKLNIEFVTTNEGKAELITLLENTVNFASELQVFTMSEEAIIDEIVNNGTQSLGVLLDSYKTSELFGKNSDNKSAYIDFISALQASDLSEIFYFDVAKEDEFSWSENMSAIKLLVDNLNTIQIDGVGLVDYMIDGGDYNKIIDALNREDADKLKPLFDSNLLYPMSSKVINEINTAIATFVEEDYAQQIKMLTLNDVVDLSAQSQEIVDVIAEAIDLDLDLLDFDNLTDEQIEQINILLSKMEINAKNNGVFKDSYNALLLKMANIIVTEIQELVGEELATKINTSLPATTEVGNDSEQLVNLLNCLLNNIQTLDCTEITKLNSSELIIVLDEFNNSREILNGYFAQPFNVLLAYVVNEINDEISYIVGKLFRENIVYCDGSEDMIREYYYIKPVIESGLSILSNDIIDVNDINIDNLQELLTSLRKCDYTTESYNSLLTYITNEMILNINTLINSSNEELTTTQYHLSNQETDIMNILKSIQETKPIIEEKGAKLSDLTLDEKSKLTKMLNVFQVNGNKSSGVFRSTYISLINYVATENGTTYEMIMENFAIDNIIDWERFVNQN